MKDVTKRVPEGLVVIILGKNINKSKFYSGRNSEQIEVRECLLSFGAEYTCIVFQSAIQDIQNYNSACCVVRV
jgi:hypothetical protein